MGNVGNVRAMGERADRAFGVIGGMKLIERNTFLNIWVVLTVVLCIAISLSLFLSVFSVAVCRFANGGDDWYVLVGVARDMILNPRSVGGGYIYTYRLVGGGEKLEFVHKVSSRGNNSTKLTTIQAHLWVCGWKMKSPTNLSSIINKGHITIIGLTNICELKETFVFVFLPNHCSSKAML